MTIRPTGRWFPLALVIYAGVLAQGCAKTDYSHLYKSAPNAPSLSPADIQALKYMGPVKSDQGYNFAIYTEHATKVQLLLFDNADANQPSKTFELTRYGNVWSVYIEGVGDGQVYGFRAWGPNWVFDPDWNPGSIKGFLSDVDLVGNRYNPNKLLIDPYSRGITRDHDWSKGSSASGPDRTNVDYGGAMKSVLVQSKYVWSDADTQFRNNRQDEHFAGHGWNDLIIYETHPKGFTMSTASGVTHPGTFRGIAEKADYLKDLGITAVQIMPVFTKPQDGGYWGYQTLNFFTPESTYAAATLPSDRVDEFKYMVDELHKRGIEVILDVVYNHTGEGGLWREKIQYGGGGLDTQLDPRTFGSYDPKDTAGLYAYRGIDNAAYYALPTDKGYYNDSMTGCGNATRSNYTPFRTLILDSLRYWVTEMHVDGFRFDLAVELGTTDPDLGCIIGDSNKIQTTVLQDIIDDPVLQRWNTRMFAEPWGMGCYGVGSFPVSRTQPTNAWYEHNGPFRDWWRSFVNYSDRNLSSNDGQIWGAQANGLFLLYGSKDFYYQAGSTLISKQRHPYNSVNFVTVHDGFTMYDVFSYNQKVNGCGPLSPDCCPPVTPYCNNDGTDDNRSFDWGPLSVDEEVACGANRDCENSCPTRNPSDVHACMDYWCWADSTCVANKKAGHEALKRKYMRDLFVAMMVARGTPLLLGGDEWMRTQLGNNNPYATRSDNASNWYDWGVWQAADERNRMHDFVSQVIRFRKEHAYAFAPTDYDTAAQLDWHSPTGGPQNMNSRSLMVSYPDTTRGPALLVLINMETASTAFSLPPGTWHRLITTDEQYEQLAGATPGSPEARRSGNVSLDTPPVVTDNPHVVRTRTIEVLQAE